MTHPRPRSHALLLFDADGLLIASGKDAHDCFPDSRVTRIDDLRVAFRALDGGPIRLIPGEPQLARAVASPAGRPVQVAVEELMVELGLGEPRHALPGGGLGAVLTVVRIGDVEAASDRVLDRALGSVLAHELRTPLTTIYGGAQLVVDSAASDATRAEAARTVAREARHLHDIVEDLVVLFRYEAVRESELEPLLLHRVLDAVVRAEQEIRPAAEIRALVPRDLPPALGNEVIVQHAFRNILTQALARCPAGTAVEVEARRAGEELEVVVRDEGPVLGADESARAFELFGGSAPTAADASGANLTAFVGRRLIESMGGRIWIAPRPRRGMETGFSLPQALG